MKKMMKLTGRKATGSKIAINGLTLLVVIFGAVTAAFAQKGVVTTPGEGQKVPLGTMVKGVCHSGHIVPARDGGYQDVANAAMSVIVMVGFGPIGEVGPPDCVPVEMIHTGFYTTENHNNLGTGQVYGKDNLKFEVIHFEVVGEKCDLKATDVNNGGRQLSAAELSSIGFDEKNPFRKQTFKTGANQRIEITLSDRSIVRLSPNSSADLDPCSEFKEGSQINVRQTLGTIWYHVTRSLGGDNKFDVETERSITGVRGTIFEISYDQLKHLTTLKVIEGSVEFSTLNGAEQGEKPLIVKTGQTARQQEDNAPTLTNSSQRGALRPTAKGRP